MMEMIKAAGSFILLTTAWLEGEKNILEIKL